MAAIKLLPVFLIGSFLCSPLIFADTIHLKSGTILEGKIIDQTTEYVEIDIEGIIVTYGMDEIKALNRVTPNTQEVTQFTDQGPVVIKTETGFKVEISTSCGNVACFEKKFKACKPATTTRKLNDVLVYRYEIIAPTDNGCMVKSEYVKHPTSEVIGKQMICEYDNAYIFDIAIENIENCKGPLYDLMFGKN